MRKIFGFCFVFLGVFCNFVFADIIYIVGADNNGLPSYWTVDSSGTPSAHNELDFGSYSSGTARAVAFSPALTVYIVGQLGFNDTVGAEYWTVPLSGSASNYTELDTSDIYDVSANSIAFNPSQDAYIVGKNSLGGATYWVVPPSGGEGSPNPLPSGNFATGVAFSPSGSGYFTGNDNSGNACYWAISNMGVVTGPFTLAGGEAGGSGSTYAVAFSPSGTAYIVGSTTSGNACYWTISPLGVASSANVLDGGTNSSARALAFVPSGEGMIVGQTSGNNSTYWLIASDGSVGTNNTLINGIGSSSLAYGIAFSSTQTAYIVGQDNAFNPVLWTVPLSGSPVTYTVLDGGLATNIAIYFTLAPNPPTALSGKTVTNDFGLVYENYAALHWNLSDSTGVVAYKIYRNGVLIATVNSSTTQYQSHDQKKSGNTVYSVVAVDGSGHESTPATITLH